MANAILKHFRKRKLFLNLLFSKDTMFVGYILEGELGLGCQATKNRPQVEASQKELVSHALREQTTIPLGV